MSEYVKTTWSKGDVITAAKMNNIEDWISGLKPTRIIDFWNLPQIEDAESQYQRQYEKNLETIDFVNCYILFNDGYSMNPILSYDFDPDTWCLELIDSNAIKYYYYPNTGEFIMSTNKDA